MRKEKKYAAAWDWTALVSLINKRPNLQQLFWVMSICLMVSVAHAETYYVSPGGADSNPGTADAPFQTISRALAVIGTVPGAGAGQAVEVAGGTYNESLIFNLPSGTSWDQPFTLFARRGEVVTIRGDGETNVYIADGIDYYSVIDGFVFDAANTWHGQALISNCCDPQPGFIRLQNNEFINNRFGGFFIAGHHIEVVSNKLHGGFEEFFDCGQVHCFGYAFYVAGSNNLFSHNEIFDVASWVFHIYDGNQRNGGPSDNVVQNNSIHDFGYGDKRADGILLSSGPRNHAYNNVVYNGYGSSGISVWFGCDGCTVLNNTISGMDLCLQVTDTRNTVIDNNTLSNCWGNYINIYGNTLDLTLSNTFCDRAADNCVLSTGREQTPEGSTSETESPGVVP
jgi:parallel beta-helix repeat protein